MTRAPEDVTRLLIQWSAEDRHALDLLVPCVYEAKGVSPATVKREWAVAKAWLFVELQK